LGAGFLGDFGLREQGRVRNPAGERDDIRLIQQLQQLTDFRCGHATRALGELSVPIDHLAGIPRGGRSIAGGGSAIFFKQDGGPAQLE
jgi:hypothetical protein